jgi:hypothetical protein
VAAEDEVDWPERAARLLDEVGVVAEEDRGVGRRRGPEGDGGLGVALAEAIDPGHSEGGPATVEDDGAVGEGLDLEVPPHGPVPPLDPGGVVVVTRNGVDAEGRRELLVEEGDHRVQGVPAPLRDEVAGQRDEVGPGPHGEAARTADAAERRVRAGVEVGQQRDSEVLERGGKAGHGDAGVRSLQPAGLDERGVGGEGPRREGPGPESGRERAVGHGGSTSAGGGGCPAPRPDRRHRGGYSPPFSSGAVRASSGP